jgi:hypothetical protein
MTEPTSEGSRIFISYRREDTAPYAGRIYDRLSDRFGEEHIFMDVDSIQLGSDFVDVLTEAISSCNAFIALIGNAWLDVKDNAGRRRIDDPHDYVHLEIATALDRNIRVIPVLVGGASLPRPEDLPPKLQGLSRRQALELSHERFRFDSARLVEALEEVLNAEASGHESTLGSASLHQGRWKTELINRDPSATTLRVSLGSDVHIISLIKGAMWDAIEVDGQRVVRIFEFKPGKEYHFTLGAGSIYLPAVIEVRQNLVRSKIRGLKLSVGGQLIYDA